jgi:hypothetical protein
MGDFSAIAFLAIQIARFSAIVLDSFPWMCFSISLITSV